MIDDLGIGSDEVNSFVKSARLVMLHFKKYDGNAPGHGHVIPGFWDNNASNGLIAGKPCDWCATWRTFCTALDNVEKVK